MTPSPTAIDIYGGRDPREIPAYGIAEAGRYLHLASATLRSWVVGRHYPRSDGPAYFSPLIPLPESDDNRLSFLNLVEAHVLWSLRTQYGVSIQAVRTALDYAQHSLGLPRVLLSPQLRTDADHLFLDRYFELINLSKSGQLAIRKAFENYLRRIEWEQDLPTRLYPVVRHDGGNGARAIVIDPFISFGRPIIRSKGVSTAAITDRYDAGESIEELATDYSVVPSEIEAAILYERSA